MADTKIKPQRHPAKSFLKSPLSLYFLLPSCLSGYKSIMQNKPNFRSDKTNATSRTPCHSDQRHASSVPKRRNLLQSSLRLPNRLFRPSCQETMPCIMQNKANFLNDRTNANTFAAKVYETKPPPPDSKTQTQSKPIPQRNTRYAIRKTYPIEPSSLP